MIANGSLIGRLIVGCVFACSLSQNINAQMPPGITNIDSGGGTNFYNPYPWFHATPTFTYPTNATLKWYLTLPGIGLYGIVSLAPDGTIYAPTAGGLLSINPTLVDTSDPNYPNPDDFENWLFPIQYNYDGTESVSSTPTIDPWGTVLVSDLFFMVSSNVLTPSPSSYGFPPYGSDVFPFGYAGLNPTNGAAAWCFANGIFANYSMPAFGNDGTLYTSQGGYVLAFTNAPGVTNAFTNAEGVVTMCNNIKLKWAYDNGGQFVNHFQRCTIFLGKDGTLFVQSFYYDNTLYAFNPTNGTLKWQTIPYSGLQAEAGAHATPAIGADGVIYFGAGSTFVAVDPSAPVTNGYINLKWVYTNSVPNVSMQYSPVIAPDGTILVESDGRFQSTNQLFAFNPANGSPKWIKPIGSGVDYYGDAWKHGSLAIAADGEIYLADSDGTVYSLAPNGNTNWSYATGAEPLNSPVIAPDGTLYVQSMDGGVAGTTLYAFQGSAPIACSAWPEDNRNARRNSAVATASVSAPFMTTNGFRVTMTGNTNFPVCDCASSDLTTWTNIGQTILTGGKTNFVDIEVTNNPYRFYRAFPQ